MKKSSPLPWLQSIRGAGRAAVFFLKVFPMLPSKPVDWVTRTPVIEKVRYPTCTGEAEGDLYRPAGDGPHPGIVVCLGVVPFGVDHPQVSVLGRALARAGFAALLYWSPAMRDLRLDPADRENVALAYNWLIDRPNVDPARSGLLGTCVGGSFALMAASHPLIRDRVAFATAYAPYSSMWTFARDIASESCVVGETRRAWAVDPLTRKVFVHSLTAWLDLAEAEQLRAAFATASGASGVAASERELLDSRALSAEGQAVYALLAAPDEHAAEQALRALPASLQERLTVMSPATYVKDLRAPLVVLLHDVGDVLIPIGESRRLVDALDGRAGVQFTEMHFQHLDPVKGKMPPHKMVRELGKFLRAVYPIFRG